MKKNRIIAICCVLVLLIAVLSSCGKKYMIIKSSAGAEYAAYTDENGSTVVDHDGMVAVYVTDSNDKKVTGEDGKEQTNYISIAERLVKGQVFESKTLRITLPSGWQANANGIFYKDGTDEKAYIQVNEFGTLEAGESFGSRIDSTVASNEQIVEKIKGSYPDTQMTVDREAVIGDNLPASVISYTIKDADGNIIHYAEAVYFMYKDNLYSINLVNSEGAGYDPNFNYFETLKTMIEFR